MKDRRIQLGVILLFIFFIAISSIYNLRKESQTVNVSIEYKEKTLAEISRIRDQVVAIRGLNITKNIDVRFVDKEWAIRNWAPRSTDVPEELKLRELFYKTTFLIDWNQSIVSLTQEWVGLFVAASSGYTLYINIDYFNPDSQYSKNVLAHELTHIMQYEHFRVNWPSCTDARNALAALVEGDAGLVQRLYCIHTKECEPSEPWTIDYNNLYLSFSAFPYIYGEMFVDYLYREGGWELVNAAYSKPPIDTYMVMYPESYIEYLRSNVSYTPCVAEAKADLVDTMGAFYLYLVLSKMTNISYASLITKEWKSDKVVISRNGNTTNIKWTIEFQEDNAAQAFYETLINYLASRAYVVQKESLDETGYLMKIDNTTVIYNILLESSNTVTMNIEVTSKLL
ncbi:MAG: DUF4157 domain-containing protein [Fervidicoccaceae archaeon]|nr:DUF4157 domain-containing protein [Fervidicoccaceae archaeon]